VSETSDRAAALAGAAVVYAKEWGGTRHYGDAEAEAAMRAGLADWCVREHWFAKAVPDAKLMHCCRCAATSPWPTKSWMDLARS